MSSGTLYLTVRHDSTAVNILNTVFWPSLVFLKMYFCLFCFYHSKARYGYRPVPCFNMVKAKQAEDCLLFTFLRTLKKAKKQYLNMLTAVCMLSSQS